MILTLSDNPTALSAALVRAERRAARRTHRQPRAGFLQRLFKPTAKPPIPHAAVELPDGHAVYSPQRRSRIVFADALPTHYLYDFCCEGCGRKEEMSVPKDKRIGIRCPAGCGTVYAQHPVDDLHDAPRLEVTFLPGVIAVD